MSIDLNSAISDIVASEVASALEPYRGLLERIAAFSGASAPATFTAKRGPGRPKAASVAAKAPAQARRPAVYGGNASAFTVGQSVKFNQGRGTFEATVVGINVETGFLTLQRAKDGKKVDRPAAKVYKA